MPLTSAVLSGHRSARAAAVPHRIAGGSAVPLDDSSPEASAWPDAWLSSPGEVVLPESGRLASSPADLPLDTADQAGLGPGRGTGLLDPMTVLIATGVTVAYSVISVFRYLRRDPT